MTLCVKWSDYCDGMILLNYNLVRSTLIIKREGLDDLIDGHATYCFNSHYTLQGLLITQGHILIRRGWGRIANQYPGTVVSAVVGVIAGVRYNTYIAFCQ